MVDILVVHLCVERGKSWWRGDDDLGLDGGLGEDLDDQHGSSLKEGSHGGRRHREALQHPGQERGGNAKRSRHQGRRSKPAIMMIMIMVMMLMMIMMTMVNLTNLRRSTSDSCSRLVFARRFWNQIFT